MRNRLALVAAAFLATACSSPAPVSTTEVQAVYRESAPGSPDDPAWSRVPMYRAALLPQDQVEPRLLAPSTTTVRVQAIHDGRRLALRMSWDDLTVDDMTDTGRFSDACAMQLPRRVEPDVPAPQMGEPGRPVEINYWKASWQASVDGRPDSIRSIHPGAVVDHYPFEAASLPPGSPAAREMAALYAPADALGRRRAFPADHAGEDLVAEGPGTLGGAGEPTSEAHGIHEGSSWEVVFLRPMPPELDASGRSQVAFAVWDGARGEVGARKMRSVWIPLAIEAAP